MAIYLFHQIMSALEYCHDLNICHRDLKPENILLTKDAQVKIADFGMAALHQSPSHQLTTACGSPHYAAPEILNDQPYKGSTVDIWSMGVILFAMLYGRLPFDEPDRELMLSKARRAEYKMPKHLSPEAQDFIRRILVVNPAMRITMKEMWESPLLLKYDFLQNEPHRPLVDEVIRNAKLHAVPEHEIDAQIFRQLRCMWHEFSERKLVEKLDSVV
jgi:serine/threonine-protein kinase HSL1, negative regulator of Swe1 kinase